MVRSADRMSAGVVSDGLGMDGDAVNFGALELEAIFECSDDFVDAVHRRVRRGVCNGRKEKCVLRFGRS